MQIINIYILLQLYYNFVYYYKYRMYNNTNFSYFFSNNTHPNIITEIKIKENKRIQAFLKT